MKIMVMLALSLFAVSLQAACKCNCDPTDRQLCASQIDLDHACPATCSSSTSAVAPMSTACPVTKITDSTTGAVKWITMCNSY